MCRLRVSGTFMLLALGMPRGSLFAADCQAWGVVSPTSPPASMRVTMPSRMVNDKSLTLQAVLLDGAGETDWRQWDVQGTISAVRASDQSSVPISIVAFDTHDGMPPPDSIRFYNGVGCATIVLDSGAEEPAGDILVSVSLSGEVAGASFAVSAAKTVTVLDDPPMRTISGALFGADLTWSPADGVIHVTGSTVMSSNALLVIEPGTLIMVDSGPAANGTVISVAGAMQAIGSEAEPIFFFPTNGPAALRLMQTCADPRYNPDSWRGIFHTGAGASQYEYVFLTGGGNGSPEGHTRPPVIRFLNSHSFSMNHCVLAFNNGKAIYGGGIGSYTIANSLVAQCGFGTEFTGNGGYSLLVEDTWFTGVGHGPEVCDYDGDNMNIRGTDPSLAGNKTIRRSVFVDGGDDGIDTSITSPAVENCIFWNLRDKALSMDGVNIFATLFNLLIFECEWAMDGHTGGRFSLDCSTLANLRRPQAIYQAVAGTFVDKCIIWPNSQSTCGNVAISNSILGTASDLGCGTGNLTIDPQFVSAANHDFHLMPDSVAHTAGPSGEQIGWLGFPAPLYPCASDLDGDGDIDLADAAIFWSALNGPDVTTPPPGCDPEDFARADLTADLDVDLEDVSLFQQAFAD